MKEGKFEINNLIFHLETLEKEGQTKCRTGQSREQKIRVEISETK